MNITKDIFVYKISEYVDGKTMFKLGLSSKQNNRIYKKYEVNERKKCVNYQNIEYIYERDNMSIEEKELLLSMMSAVSGKSVNFYKKKIINLIIARKNSKKLQHNYRYLYDCFSPDKHTKWLFKHATDELLADIYFLDIEGYKSFVNKTSNLFIRKCRKKRTQDRINWFVDEIGIHNYIIENQPQDWWLAAVEHCFNRSDSDDLLKKLVNKMHIFNVYKDFYENILIITELIFSFEPTEDRARYLSYFDLNPDYLLLSIEEFQAHVVLHEGYKSWLYYIIKNKEAFGLEDLDFTREALEDRLLPYEFVDNVVSQYKMITYLKCVLFPDLDLDNDL
jgi:hypothetical protein